MARIRHNRSTVSDLQVEDIRRGRSSLIHPLRVLLRKYADLLINEIEADKVTSVKARLEQMVALIESVGEHDRA